MSYYFYYCSRSWLFICLAMETAISWYSVLITHFLRSVCCQFPNINERRIVFRTGWQLWGVACTSRPLSLAGYYETGFLNWKYISFWATSSADTLQTNPSKFIFWLCLWVEKHVVSLHPNKLWAFRSNISQFNSCNANGSTVYAWDSWFLRIFEYSILICNQLEATANDVISSVAADEISTFVNAKPVDSRSNCFHAKR